MKAQEVLKEFLLKTKEIIFTPSFFFKRIKKEKGYLKSLLFLLFLTSFSFILTALVAIIFYKGTPPKINFILIAFLFFISSFLSTLILSAILQIILFLVKSQQKFEKAFQIQVYIRIPGAITGALPYGGLISLIWGGVLLYLGVKEIYSLSKVKAVVITACWLLVVIVLPILLLRFFPTRT